MTEGRIVGIPGLVAGEDLSAKQYRYVKLSGDGTVVLCSGATDIPIGILQNKPTSGQAAQVAGCGSQSKVEVDSTAIAAGDMIGTSADGQADKKTPGSDTTEYMCGQCLIGAAAGARALVTFDAPRKAT